MQSINSHTYEPSLSWSSFLTQLSKLVSFWNGEVADDDAHHTREVVKTIARVALMSGELRFTTSTIQSVVTALNVPAAFHPVARPAAFRPRRGCVYVQGAGARLARVLFTMNTLNFS